MKKRYLYSLLFAMPGLPVALLVALFVSGAGAGFLWLFVHGDNTWPASAERLLPALFMLTLLVVWGMTLVAGYLVGKQLEDVPGVERRHVLLSIAFTALPVALILLHQLGVGNIGNRPETLVCSERCSELGYAASGMDPGNPHDRACICFDSHGQEAIRLSR